MQLNSDTTNFDSDLSRTGYRRNLALVLLSVERRDDRAMVYLMSYEDIPEFEGCEFAEEIKVIENYVLGIGEVPMLK